MKSIKELFFGLLFIAAVGAALILSDKYFKQEPKSYSDQNHNPSNRLQQIRDGVKQK